MVKKWINIILSVWLINSVTFVQTNDITDTNHHCLNTNAESLNSWTGYFSQSLSDQDSAPTSDKKHHTEFHRRYVHSKSHHATRYLAENLLYQPYNSLKKAVKKSISTYIIGMALLPAYYSFLFRLNPF